jgi:hypothetical protein
MLPRQKLPRRHSFGPVAYRMNVDTCCWPSASQKTFQHLEMPSDFTSYLGPVGEGDPESHVGAAESAFSSSCRAWPRESGENYSEGLEADEIAPSGFCSHARTSLPLNGVRLTRSNQPPSPQSHLKSSAIHSRTSDLTGNSSGSECGTAKITWNHSLVLLQRTIAEILR